PRDLEALRRDEEKIELAVEVRAAGRSRRLAVAARMDWVAGDAAARELRHLVFHERDERADDERRSAARQARKLIAERFARPRRHHEEHVVPERGGATRLFLVGPVRRKTEPVAQERAQAFGPHSGPNGRGLSREGRRGRRRRIAVAARGA